MEKLFSGKTLQEAKEKAYQFFANLGISEDDIDTQILEQPVKKFFGGLKGEFKINFIVDDGLLTTQKSKDEQDAQKSGSPQEVEEKPLQDFSPSANEPDVIVKYLTSILDALGAKDYKINVLQKDDITVFDIAGEKLGVAIGRRGETLDALQYLSILANNRSGQPYKRISIDCNGYRDKRSETLEVLAIRTAKKVLAQGRRITLEPMNPYERRIIHGKVSEIEGVYSNSVGDEPYRKVVISASIPRHRRHKHTTENDQTSENNKTTENSENNTNKPRRSYKQSTGFQTSFERDYKRSKNDDVKISQDTVDLEKNTSLYGKIEL